MRQEFHSPPFSAFRWIASPSLGVCLGHQSIGQSFGGKIVHAKQLMHGKTSAIYHNNSSVFHGLPNPFTATRYHSLVIERATLPECLEVTAWTEDGEIMGSKSQNDGGRRGAISSGVHTH
jgi:anthranilate synthase/aminodeoxychorismate synthase-like glutamine amidotransferase